MARQTEAALFDRELLLDLDFKSDTEVSQVKFSPLVTVQSPGDNFVVRPLEVTDYSKGYMHLLSQLTISGDVTEDVFVDRFRKMQASPDTYYVTVVEDTSTGRVVASATLLIEFKFIRACALRGRIEDVVVDSDYRGAQLGKLLVCALKLLAKKLGCYKLSLDCKDPMKPFYERFGFHDKEANYMVIRF